MINLINKSHSSISSSCNDSSSSSSSITIYPYRSLNNISTRLEFQEKCIKLALKTASSQQQDEFNFLFVASAHVDQESCCMSLLIEQFDKGQTKFGSNNKFLMPTAPLPDAIYIPARLVYQHQQQNDLLPIMLTNDDSSVAYYLNSIKFLVNYFQKFCSTLDSINKIMSISSSIHYTPMGNCINASFDLITLANCFDASRIQPIPIIETSLLKTLQATSSFYLKPKTGYCALYKNENIILLMDSEPKANKLALTGIWVSGMNSLNHPLTWAACIRYTFSSLITNKTNELMNSFLVILFPSTSKRPEFYLCNPIQSCLEFTLLNGSSKFITNKTNNENRYMTIDLNEVKEGFNFKLFRNSLNQVFAQDIYGQHQILSNKQIVDHSDLQLVDNINDTILSNSTSFTSDINNDTDLQPRSLNNTLISNKLILIEKQDNNNSSSSSSSSNSNNNSTSSSASSSSLSSYPINFLQQQKQQLASINNNNNNLVKKETLSSNLSNPCIGSYHSVSDISVLSDNENEENNNNNNATSFFTNSLNASSGIHTMSTQSYFSNNNSIKQQNDYEFLRPKDPPPMPSNFNRYLFNNSNNNVNSLSCSSSNSSLSPSPTPPQPVLLVTKMKPILTQSSSSSLSVKSNDPYENSKSMMFGIPRDSPMPIYPSVSNDFHQTLDSPFVDVTLNNCDDISLYQPPINVVILNNNNNNSSDDMRKPILKKQQQLQNDNFHHITSDLNRKEPKLNNFNNRNLDLIANNNNNTNNEIFLNQNFINQHPKTSNNYLTSSSTPLNNNNNICLSSSSSSSISSLAPAKSSVSNLQQQQQQQQQNPSFLNSSVYSSVSLSSNTSSNNSNHSSNYSYSTKNNNNQQQSLINSNNSSINNENLFNYNNNHQKFKPFQTIQQQQTPVCNNKNYIEQLSTMHPQDIADLIMNKDEQLQSQLVEMNRLQETMNSLNLINKKQQMLNNSTTPSSYNTTNNNSEIANIANSISQLAHQIEERKNSIKNNLFNSFNSQIISSTNSTPNLLKQQQNNSSRTNLEPLAKFQQNFHSSNHQQQHQQHQQQQRINDVKTKYNEIDEQDEVDEEEVESKIECENVFGAALKQKLDWQQQVSNNKSVCSTEDTNTSILLQKFNYVSLLLDDYCDKNTSMNTKALAYKYLNKKDVTLSTNSNYDMSLYTANSYYTQSGSNTTLLSSTSTLPPLDSSKYEFNPKMPLFQYYTDTTTINNDQSFKCSTKPDDSANSLIQNNNINNNNHLLNETNKHYPVSSSINSNQNYLIKNNNNLSSDEKEFNNNNNDDDEDDADSESDQIKRNNNKIFNNNDDRDDDEEIWLFGKPNSVNSNKLTYTTDQKTKQNQKTKQKQRIQRQQRRDNKEKDFSDQDEPDRDVTTVLDIEKLKRLPKLL